MAEFDRFADDYESVLDQSLGLVGDGSEYFAGQKAEYLRQQLGVDFSGKLLDFGCGIGLLSSALAPRLPDAELHGFDISEDSVARVPEKLRTEGLFTTRLERLSTDYGAIVAANVFHHIPPADRTATMGDLAQRLRPGGKLVVIEHNPLNPATRYIVATCPLDENAVLLPVRETRQLLEGAGLSIARRDYIAFFPRPLRALRPLEARLTWLPLGAQYAVVAVAHRNG